MSLLDLLNLVEAPPKSKKVCQSMKRRFARLPPRMSLGSGASASLLSKMSAKNSLPSALPKFTR